MSITLLEFVVAGILIVVAWQIGITIAPWIFRKLRGLKEELDDVAQEIEPDHAETASPNPKDDARSNHNYRNN